MTADGTDHFLGVKEFATQVQEELVQSTSEGSSLFHIIFKKAFAPKSEDLSVFQFIPGARLAFVSHNFLKKADILLLISTVFDCIFGCGSGAIIFGIYNRLKPFGSNLFFPVITTVAIIFGFNGFIYDGIFTLGLNGFIYHYFFIYDGFLKKLLQGLMMLIFIKTSGIRDLFNNIGIAISYASSVQCITETCIECQLPFSQPLLSSTKICICVCQNCLRKSDDCTKCQSSPCTGRYTIVFTDKRTDAWWDIFMI